MKDKKKRLQYPVYFGSGNDNFSVDTNESDKVENLVGNINSVIKRYGLCLCYCDDEKKDKTIFSAWEIRPFPETDIKGKPYKEQIEELEDYLEELKEVKDENPSH